MNSWSPNPVTRWRFFGDRKKAQSMRQSALQLMGVLKSMRPGLDHFERKLQLSDGGEYVLKSRHGQDEIWITYPKGGEVGSYSPYLFIACRFIHPNGHWEEGNSHFIAVPNMWIYEPNTTDDLGETVYGELLAAEFYHQTTDAFTAQHPLDKEFGRSDDIEEFDLGRYDGIVGDTELWLTHTSHNFCMSTDVPWDPDNGINIDEDYDFNAEKWQTVAWLDPEDPEKNWTKAAPNFFPEVDFVNDDNVDIYKSCAKSGQYQYVRYEDIAGDPDLVDGSINLRDNAGPLPTDWTKRGIVQGGWYVVKIGAIESLCGLNTGLIPEVEIRLGRPPNQLRRRYTLPEIQAASFWFRDLYPYGYYVDFGQTDYFGEEDDVPPKGGYGENPHGYPWWKGAFLINVGTGQIAVDIDDLLPIEGRIQYFEGDTLDNQYLPDDTSFYTGAPETENVTQATEGLCHTPPPCLTSSEWPYGDPTVSGSFRFQTEGDKYYKASPVYLFDGVCSVVCRLEVTLFNDGESPFLTGVVQHESGEFYTGSINVYDPNNPEAVSRAEDQIANLEFGDECYIVGINHTVVDIDPDTGEKTWVKDVQVVFLPEPLGDGWQPYDPLTS